MCNCFFWAFSNTASLESRNAVLGRIQVEAYSPTTICTYSRTDMLPHTVKVCEATCIHQETSVTTQSKLSKHNSKGMCGVFFFPLVLQIVKVLRSRDHLPIEASDRYITHSPFRLTATGYTVLRQLIRDTIASPIGKVKTWSVLLILLHPKISLPQARSSAATNQQSYRPERKLKETMFVLRQSWKREEWVP